MNISDTQHIGLIIKPHDDLVENVARKLSEYLLAHFKAIYVDEDSNPLPETDRIFSVTRQKIVTSCELVVALGGDGTLLSAARTVVRKGIPLIGINLGTLGFLAEISPSTMNQQLDEIFAGKFRLEERSMLTMMHFCNGIVEHEYDACNDIVIKHHISTRVIEVDTTVNGNVINSLRADGLIVATPTGSTAYALSSGGPLVEPTLKATLIVPICPHTLSHRPLIIDSDKTIELGYNDLYNSDPGLVSVDGQIHEIINPGDKIVIKPLLQKLHLIQPENHDYFHTLRNKLRWSEKL